MTHYHELIPNQVYIGSPLGVHEAIEKHGVTDIFDLRDSGDIYDVPVGATRHPHPIIEGENGQDVPLQTAIAAVKEAVDEGKVVYFHCSAGRNRTGTVATALLMELKEANTVEEALQKATAKRPVLSLRPEMVEALNRLYT